MRIPLAGIQPQESDSPVAALPLLDFPALRGVDHEMLKILLDANIEGDLRIDVESLARNANIPLLGDEDEGPTIDFSSQPSSSPFGEPSMRSNDPEIEGTEDIEDSLDEE